MDTEYQLTLFTRHLKGKGRSLNTIRAYVSDARVFLNWNPEAVLTTDNIAEHVAAYINGLDGSAATINRRMASLRLFARVVYGTEVLVDHTAPRVMNSFAHPLPDGIDDIRKMLAAAPPEHQPLIALCGYAGARVSEARAVMSDDVRRIGTTFWVRLHGKGRTDREVPLPDEALPYLLWGEGVRMCKLGDRGARYAIARAAAKAGVSRPVASHDLRMTFGTAVYDNTKDLRTTQELLGHRSSITTQRYTGIRPATMAAAVQGAFK